MPREPFALITHPLVLCRLCSVPVLQQGLLDGQLRSTEAAGWLSSSAAQRRSGMPAAAVEAAHTHASQRQACGAGGKQALAPAPAAASYLALQQLRAGLGRCLLRSAAKQQDAPLHAWLEQGCADDAAHQGLGGAGRGHRGASKQFHFQRGMPAAESSTPASSPPLH